MNVNKIKFQYELIKIKLEVWPESQKWNFNFKKNGLKLIKLIYTWNMKI